jgi:ketosteroid isomerase-like protein
MATQVGSAREVFDHHIRALGKGDLDDILSDYTEDSVVIGPDGVVKGRQAISTLFQGFLSGLLKPGTWELGLDVEHVHDDLVYVIWHAKCAPADVAFAADTFVIRDGKIAVHTFAPKIEPHNQPQVE